MLASQLSGNWSLCRLGCDGLPGLSAESTWRESHPRGCELACSRQLLSVLATIHNQTEDSQLVGLPQLPLSWQRSLPVLAYLCEVPVPLTVQSYFRRHA